MVHDKDVEGKKPFPHDLTLYWLGRKARTVNLS